MEPDDPTQDTPVIYVKDKDPKPEIPVEPDKPNTPGSTDVPDTKVTPDKPTHPVVFEEPETPEVSKRFGSVEEQSYQGDLKQANVSDVKYDKAKQSKTELPQTGEEQNKDMNILALVLASISATLGMFGIVTTKRQKKSQSK